MSVRSPKNLAVVLACAALGGGAAFAAGACGEDRGGVEVEGGGTTGGGATGGGATGGGQTQPQ